MKIKIFAILLCILAFAQITQAQSKAAQLKEWERAKAYTKEYLDAMPDNAYTLKPSPEMRSFAEQLLHLADANYGFTSGFSGIQNPNGQEKLENTPDKSKENVSRLVLSSYDFVIENIGKLSDQQLEENIKLFGQMDMSRNTAIAKLFEHQTHHRGQTTVYIRLAKTTPPNEKLF